MNILLTGATGFIGKVLAKELLDNGLDLWVVVRSRVDYFPNAVTQFVVGDFLDNLSFKVALKDIDCVIHLAGKAHVTDSKRVPVLDDFRKINTELTLNLAKQAADTGIKRFVFLSSIGVNGNQNSAPFVETDVPNPQEPYAVSKYEAEQGLLKIAKETDMEVVIIRPPLVYGKNAPGNFGRLVQWVSKRHFVLLPLGAIHNKRSLVAIDNLVDFIIICIRHERVKNEIFLISDRQDLSTTTLLKKLGTAFNKKVFLLPIPVSWMRFFAKLVGKQADTIRLFSSLQVDNSKARDLLDWEPIISIDQQLQKIAHEKSV